MKTRLKVVVGIVASLALGSWWVASKNPESLGEQAVIAIRDTDDHALLESLLKQGADPNYNLACTTSDPQSVSLLLKYGANPNMLAYDDWTALMVAIRDANTETVRLLLEHGADPNYVDQGNRTALSQAIEFKKSALIPLLKQAGARGKINERKTAKTKTP